MNSLLGLNIIVSPDHPKYELPREVIPGVPWPPGFREDINAWSLGFLGTRNLLKNGEVLAAQGAFYLNPRTYAQLRKQLS